MADQPLVTVHFRAVIPIRPGVTAELLVPRPMNEQDWTQMLKVLRKMKPGIVSHRDPRGTDA